MKPRYRKWIEDYIQERKSKGLSVRNTCNHASKKMQSRWPNDLTLCQGYVLTIEGQDLAIPHTWLEDKNGRIIDPTESQFYGVLSYIPVLKTFNGFMCTLIGEKSGLQQQALDFWL